MSRRWKLPTYTFASLPRAVESEGCLEEVPTYRVSGGPPLLTLTECRALQSRGVGHGPRCRVTAGPELSRDRRGRSLTQVLSGSVPDGRTGWNGARPGKSGQSPAAQQFSHSLAGQALQPRAAAKWLSRPSDTRPVLCEWPGGFLSQYLTFSLINNNVTIANTGTRDRKKTLHDFTVLGMHTSQPRITPYLPTPPPPPPRGSRACIQRSLHKCLWEGC